MQLGLCAADSQLRSVPIEQFHGVAFGWTFVLVDVLGPVLYLWPPRHHYHEVTRFRRAKRGNGLR